LAKNQFQRAENEKMKKISVGRAMNEKIYVLGIGGFEARRPFHFGNLFAIFVHANILRSG
jgi:hypothetical protein